MTNKSNGMERALESSHDHSIGNCLNNSARTSIDDGWILCPKLESLLSLRKPLVQLTPRRLVINVASVEELCKLPGLGRKRAERIVAHRESHGPFASTAELHAIPGIGKRIVDGLAGGLAGEPKLSPLASTF